jgi:hypothetical protein
MSGSPVFRATVLRVVGAALKPLGRLAMRNPRPRERTRQPPLTIDRSEAIACSIKRVNARLNRGHPQT